MSPTPEELRARFESLPSEDLIAALHPQAGYTEVAVAVAREVLGERGVDLESPAARELNSRVEAGLKEKAEAADEPLGVGTRAVCVIFCGFPAAMIAAVQFARGHTRRGNEALQWMAIGIVVWIVLGILVRL